jgi:hypothetical protein
MRQPHQKMAPQLFLRRRYVDHRVSALDLLPDVTPDGRHRPRHGAGNAFNPHRAVPILAVWLYGTLVLAERRSGYVIILLGSLLGLVVPVIHMKGAGVGGAIAKSSGAFFFIWTLLALGVTALFSVILSARGLWEHLPWGAAAQHKQGARA